MTRYFENPVLSDHEYELIQMYLTFGMGLAHKGDRASSQVFFNFVVERLANCFAPPLQQPEIEQNVGVLSDIGWLAGHRPELITDAYVAMICTSINLPSRRLSPTARDGKRKKCLEEANITLNKVRRIGCRHLTATIKKIEKKEIKKKASISDVACELFTRISLQELYNAVKKGESRPARTSEYVSLRAPQMFRRIVDLMVADASTKLNISKPSPSG